MITFNSKPSFQSQSSLVEEDQPAKEPEEQIILREKRLLNALSLERFQACERVVSKYANEQKERVSNLKEKYRSNIFFMEFCDKLEV